MEVVRQTVATGNLQYAGNSKPLLMIEQGIHKKLCTSNSYIEVHIRSILAKHLKNILARLSNMIWRSGDLLPAETQNGHPQGDDKMIQLKLLKHLAQQFDPFSSNYLKK